MSIGKLTELLTSDDISNFMQGLELLVSLEDRELEYKILGNVSFYLDTQFSIGTGLTYIRSIDIGDEGDSIYNRENALALILYLAYESKNILAQQLLEKIECISVSGSVGDFIEHHSHLFPRLKMIEFDDTDDWNEEDFQSLEKLKKCRGIERLNFRNTYSPLPEEYLAKFSDVFPGLTHIEVGVEEGSSMEVFTSMEKLRCIIINVSDEEKTPPPQLHLTELKYFELNGYLPVDRLPTAQNLEYLDVKLVDPSFFSGEEDSRENKQFVFSMKEIVKRYPKLKSLILSSKYDSAILTDIIELSQLKNLHKLNFKNVRFDKEAEFRDIFKLPVSVLEITGHEFSEDIPKDMKLEISNEYMKEVEISLSHITDIVFKNCANLKNLQLQKDEPIDSISILSSPVDYFSIRKAPVRKVEISSSNIEELNLENYNLEELVLDNLRCLSSIEIAKNPNLKSISMNRLPVLSQFDASFCINLSEENTKGIESLKDSIRHWKLDFTSFSDEFCKDFEPFIRLRSKVPIQKSFRLNFDTAQSIKGIIPVDMDEWIDEELTSSLSKDVLKVLEKNKGFPATKYIYNSDNSLTAHIIIKNENIFSFFEYFYKKIKPSQFQEWDYQSMPIQYEDLFLIEDKKSDELDDYSFEMEEELEDFPYDKDQFQPLDSHSKEIIKAYRLDRVIDDNNNDIWNAWDYSELADCFNALLKAINNTDKG